MPIRNYILPLVLVIAFAAPVFAQNALPGASGLGDSLYPGFGNSGYDVQHYTLDLTVNPDSGSIVGTATIDALATQDLSRFNLDLIGMEVENITVDDTPAAFMRAGQELTITPAAPVAGGSAFVTVIVYSGVPEEMVSQAFPGQTGWFGYDGGIYVMGQPDGAAGFYPANDHPLDKARYTLRVTVPEPYTVATNGIITAITDNGDTTTTVSEVRQPMASYLTTINIARFDRVEDTSGNGVPIRNYFEVGLSAGARANFARQGDMLDYFESLFGDYPFDLYGAVVVNTETESALETQTLSIFGVDMLEESRSTEGERIVAHELAHQWFGNSVTLADWGDIWLNEGWATYSEGLWIEHSDGRRAFDAWALDLYDYISEEMDDLPPPGEPPADDLFSDSVYDWGALTLHALRARVGDDAFFEIARVWLDHYRYGNAGTAEFIDVVAQVTGEDYTDFFDAWLYSGDLPDIPELGWEH